MKGKLIVISGPSGVGKSTIRKEIVNNIPNTCYSISATTRKPRDGETDGVDYYFLSCDEFNKEIENDNFIEYVEVYDNTFYGTLKSEVLKKINSGINIILEIDVDGALKIKDKFPESILIFIAPPDIKDLEKRLKERNTDSLDKINERVKKAKYELSFKDDYDYVVINNDVNKAIKDLEMIINTKIKA